MDTINVQRSFVKYMNDGLTALGVSVAFTETMPDEQSDKMRVNHVNISFASEGKSPYSIIKDLKYTEVVIDVIHKNGVTAASWRDAVWNLLKPGYAAYYEFTSTHPGGDAVAGKVITWESDEFDFAPFGDDVISRHSGSLQIHFRT